MDAKVDKTPQMPAQTTMHGLTINADLSQGPYFIDGCDTLPKLVKQRCEELGERVAHREKDFGIWLSFSWNDFYKHAKLIGLGLISLGMKRGQVVSVLSEDNKEWVYIDLAVQSIGGICSGIYTTDSASQVDYLVNDSDSQFLFIENDEQLDKFLEVKDKLKGLVKAIVMDRDGLHDFEDDKVIFLDDLYALGVEFEKENAGRFEEEIALSKPDDIAILVYTSGTTGMPKGAMISHSNILFSVSSGLEGAPVYPTDEQICFLPLCHILERLFSGHGPIAS